MAVSCPGLKKCILGFICYVKVKAVSNNQINRTQITQNTQISADLFY